MWTRDFIVFLWSSVHETTLPWCVTQMLSTIISPSPEPPQPFRCELPLKTSSWVCIDPLHWLKIASACLKAWSAFTFGIHSIKGWSCGQHVWLLIIRSRVRSPALPQMWIRSGTGSTQPREDNWVATRLRKSTLLDLTERNANHIIPSCCHLSVSCWSIVDRCGSLGSCKPQI